MPSNKESWTTAALERYAALLRKEIDAHALPECELSDDEQRERERFRLGIAPRIDTQAPRRIEDQSEGAHTLIAEPSSSSDAVPAESEVGVPPLRSVESEVRHRHSEAASHVEFYEPESCPYCGRSPCFGPTHHAYATAHALDPIEVERRRTDLQAREEFTRNAWSALGITPPEY